MPSRTPELELKFSAPADFAAGALALQAGIEHVELPAQNLVAVYYDTDDLRLARAGVTLRYRTGDGDDAGWTLKLPAQDKPALREEVRIENGKDGVPEEARRLVTAFARGAELLKVVKLRTRRRRWSLRETDGREVAELVDDRVSVLDGRRVTQRFRELELEARAGDRAGLKPIEAALGEMGFAQSSQMPKAVRALGPKAAEPSDIPEGTSVSPRGPVAEAVAAAIASAVHRLMVHDPYARLHDAEGIHQMRVSARRLRGYLRTFSSLVEPAWADGIDFRTALVGAGAWRGEGPRRPAGKATRRSGRRRRDCAYAPTCCEERAIGREALAGQGARKRPLHRPPGASHRGRPCPIAHRRRVRALSLSPASASGGDVGPVGGCGH